MARGLTLAALGHLASLIKDQDNVHFRILERLESQHPMEQESVLYCIGRLVALNVTVARAFLQRSPAILANESVGDRFKLGVIRVLARVPHSDATVSSEARRQLVELMQRVPKEDFVVGALEALSRSAVDSFLFTEPQLGLLWEHLLSDPRLRVRLTCVRGLVAVARASPYLGNFRSQTALQLLAVETNLTIQTALLALVATLARHWHLENVAYDTKSIVHCLQTLANHPRAVTWALRALAAAAGVSPDSAKQLRDHIASTLPTVECRKRDAFLTAALALCGSDVATHSPGLGEEILSMLLHACSGTGTEKTLALLHAVSCGIGNIVTFARAEYFSDRLALLAQQLLTADAVVEELASQCFASAVISHLRSVPLVIVGGDITRSFGSLVEPLMKQAGVWGSRSGHWRWASYCIAKEAVLLGLVVPAIQIFGRLAQDPLPESSRVRNWLLFLAEWSRGEAQAQAGNFIDAGMIMHRSMVLLVAGGPPAAIQTGSTAVSALAAAQILIPTNSRARCMAFAKRFCAWKLALVEAAPTRPNTWVQLGGEALQLSIMFPDMTGGACRQYLRDAASCCFAIGGSKSKCEQDGRQARAETGKQTLLSRLRSALDGGQRPADIKDALLVAASVMPRYFFHIQPTFWVELAFGKPVVEDAGSLLYSADTGHVVSIDGIVHRRAHQRPCVAVEIAMKVIWSSSEKASVVSRQLAGGSSIRKSQRVVTERIYSFPIVSDSFNTAALVSMPLEPRNGHVVLVNVTLIDSDGFRWENVACESFAAEHVQ